MAARTLPSDERLIGAHRCSYRGFTIKVKQDFGHTWHLIDGLPCRWGYVVLDEHGCNAMPAATWFQTVTEAKRGVDCWIASGFSGPAFWAMFRAQEMAPVAWEARVARGATLLRSRTVQPCWGDDADARNAAHFRALAEELLRAVCPEVVPREGVASPALVQGTVPAR